MITEHHHKNIGLAVMTITTNTAGGQPIFMQNMAGVAAICKKYTIPLDMEYLVSKRGEASIA